MSILTMLTGVIVSPLKDTITLTIEDKNDLLENAAILANHLITRNFIQYIQPHFHTTIVKDVSAFLIDTWEGVGILTEEVKREIQSHVEQSMKIFYTRIAPPRVSGPTFIRLSPLQLLALKNKMTEKITYLKGVTQPEQRTTAWYEFRYRYLTASNIWKAFISESTKNQLIFEKCKPLLTPGTSGSGGGGGVSLDSPMHWGNKYEPLSIKIYEKMFETQISDFGCIPHKDLAFLAASPDGINTASESPRYGRMLEVKNIVNREINGNPKMEYWIQMQVQMEVCDLHECDFLETRFVEYPDEAAYAAAPAADTKGLIMLFMKDGHPVYEYAPLDATNLADWQEEMMEKNKAMTWSKNIYWRLDQLSCVLVLRNKLWFKAAIPYLEEIWGIIQKERVTGYEHRGPKKSGARAKKPFDNSNSIDITKTATCFITMDTTNTIETNTIETNTIETNIMDTNNMDTNNMDPIYKCSESS